MSKNRVMLLIVNRLMFSNKKVDILTGKLKKSQAYMLKGETKFKQKLWLYEISKVYDFYSNLIVGADTVCD